MTFSNKILTLRKKNGISQKALGEAIGVSRLSIINYEKGTKQPKRSTLVKIAEYFNVPIEYFNEEKYEPMDALVSIVAAGGGASEGTLKYRVNLSNKWMQVMGITKENRLVDLLYNDNIIIIRKAGSSDNSSFEKRTVTVKISTTNEINRYMIVLLNRWMLDMGITEKNRKVKLNFDGQEITITKDI